MAAPPRSPESFRGDDPCVPRWRAPRAWAPPQQPRFSGGMPQRAAAFDCAGCFSVVPAVRLVGPDELDQRSERPGAGPAATVPAGRLHEHLHPCPVQDANSGPSQRVDTGEKVPGKSPGSHTARHPNYLLQLDCAAAAGRDRRGQGRRPSRHQLRLLVKSGRPHTSHTSEWDSGRSGGCAWLVWRTPRGNQQPPAPLRPHCATAP